MCGICGVFALAEPVGTMSDRSAVQRMVSEMGHRGPDGEGLRTLLGGVTLGHCRLAIIDLSPDGLQPMVDDRQHAGDGAAGSWIVFNGEIYNFQELRAELTSRGHAFRTATDTEVIMKMYAEYGEGMLTRIRGMFAFALWDGRREQLLLVRDPFGIKPLYWCVSGERFWFASELGALIAASGMPRETAPAALVGFLSLGSVPEPLTMFRGVHALPAGHAMTVKKGAIGRPHAYSTMRSKLLGARAAGSSALSCAEVAAEVARSVGHHLVADVPVGLFLSAGIDSAILAASAARRRPDLRTVTVGFKEFAGTDADETPGAARLARHLGIDNEQASLSKAEFTALEGAFLAAMDSPTIDGWNTFLISQVARRLGLKVVMSGLGGDELFASYPSFRQVPALARTLRHVTPGIGRLLRRAGASLAARFGAPKAAGIFEYGGSIAGAYFLKRGLYMPWEVEAMLGPVLFREGWEELDLLRRMAADVEGLGERAAVTVLESAWYMRNQLLRDSDWASMAASLELRVPLVDWHLFDALAPAIAADTLPNKRDVLRSLVPDLPEAILVRGKTGFMVPLPQWTRASGGSETSWGRTSRAWALAVLRAYTTKFGIDAAERVRHPGMPLRATASLQAS